MTQVAAFGSLLREEAPVVVGILCVLLLAVLA